ncbi:hypothetical protein [Vampirovibrio chlorellavorus]|uniref:hypothetical protein n=1 Tax=Vampirovibrio chlorellavorus TaxID=758823 RepID=UPI0026E98D9A|nr:hypothetical protein [Vampirovibrio chlorellavorus]
MHSQPLNRQSGSQRFLPLALSALFLFSALAMPASVMAAPPASKPTPVQKKEPGKPPATDKVDKKEPMGKLDAKEKAALDKEIEASVASATKVDSLELLKNPSRHLNQKVTFTGVFNRFADTALDYKKAFRDSRDYVSFFILRPDVSQHTIPLSELKLFFPRKKSSEVMDLETGDKIQIVGTQFSNALDEPWVDVEHIKILQKTEKPERKHDPEF